MTYEEWAAQTDPTVVLLVDMTVLRLADSVPISLYLGSHTFNAPDRQYLPCISDLPRLTRTVNTTLDPNYLPSYGELLLALEPDYCPDPANSIPWKDLLGDAYNLVNMPLTIRMGGPELAYDDFKKIFIGRTGKPTWTQSNLKLVVYDKIKDLETKVPDAIVGNSNLVPPESWAKSLPLVMGVCKNFSPVLMNTAATLVAPYFPPLTVPNNPYRWALGGHQVGYLSDIFDKGCSNPDNFSFMQNDVSIPYPDQPGTPVMMAYGAYTGAENYVHWVVKIDNVIGGGALGDATFRWSKDGGKTWEATGLSCLGLTHTGLTKSVALGGSVLTLGDYYTGSNVTYVLTIARGGSIGGALAPQFRFSENGGSTWSALIDILSTTAIPLSHGLTASFTNAGGVGAAVKTPAGSSTGDLTPSGAFTGVAATPFQVVITTGGNIGDETAPACKFTKDGGSTWTEGIPITGTAPIALAEGIEVAFTHPGGTEYEVGDLWDFTAYLAFVGDDSWTWGFAETYIGLGDGISIQWSTGYGEIFGFENQWDFWLCSTISLNAAGYAAFASAPSLTVDAAGYPLATYGVGSLPSKITFLATTFAGWGPDDFDMDSLVNLNANFPYEVGLLVDSPKSILDIFNSMLSGLPLIYTIRLDGKFYIGLLRLPSGTPVATLTPREILESPESSLDTDNLYRRVYLNYDHNPNTDTSPATGTTVGRAEWLKSEWKICSARNDSVRDRFPWAQDLGPLDTLLTIYNEASALAAKLLNWYSFPHGFLKPKVKIQVFTQDLDTVVEVIWPRFGLEAGKLFITAGLELDLKAKEAALTLRS